MVAATSACEDGARQLQTVDGGTVDPAGKVLLVNYWAEWCKPCREEVPELNHFATADQQVLVVGVNYDQPPAGKNLAQMAKLGIEFPVLAADPAARWQRERPSVLPSTFVIGTDGRWRATLVGPQTQESLQRAVDNLVRPGDTEN